MGKMARLVKAMLASLGIRHKANRRAYQPETEMEMNLRRIGVQLSKELKLMLHQSGWNRERFATFNRMLNHEMSVCIDDSEREFQTVVEVVIDTAGRFNRPPLHLVVYPTRHEVKSLGRFATSPEELAKLVDSIHSYLWSYIYNIPVR